MQQVVATLVGEHLLVGIVSIGSQTFAVGFAAQPDKAAGRLLNGKFRIGRG